MEGLLEEWGAKTVMVSEDSSHGKREGSFAALVLHCSMHTCGLGGRERSGLSQESCCSVRANHFGRCWASMAPSPALLAALQAPPPSNVLVLCRLQACD